MDAGANTGAPSPNFTIPSLCVALSRSTLSPQRMGRAFTMSLIGCLLFAESSFAPYRTNLKVLGSNTIGFRSWDGTGEVLILAWLGYWDESVTAAGHFGLLRAAPTAVRGAAAQYRVAQPVSAEAFCAVCAQIDGCGLRRYARNKCPLHQQAKMVRPVEIALLALLGLLWGMPYALTKIALTTIPPVTLVAARVALAAILLWIIVFFRQCRMPWGRDLVA